MTSLNLSFKEWPYPGKGETHSCCSWSGCGFFAYSLGNTVSVFSNEIDKMSPMYMWNPFDSEVSALAWADGSCSTTVMKPILAISSTKGMTAVYDYRTKQILGTIGMRKEIGITIAWSHFDPNKFYIGTNEGNLLTCRLTNFPSVDVVSRIKFDFPIDYLALSNISDNLVAVASKNGNFAIITNEKPRKYFTEPSITSFSFFPNSKDFLVVANDKESKLISIEDCSEIPFISSEGIRMIHVLTSDPKRIIIGYDNKLCLWEYKDDMWTCLSVANLNNMKSKLPEASLYSSLDDQIMVVTAHHWLTIVEVKRNKLFITHRYRLMQSKPMDWDFRKGAIAFAHKDGTVSITSWTPDSIIKPPFGLIDHDVPSAEDLKSLADSELDIIPKSLPGRRNSSPKIKWDSQNVFEEMAKQVQTTKTDVSKYGNSNSIVLQFKISNKPIENIKWAPGGRLILWTADGDKTDLKLLDLRNRQITSILEEQLKVISSPMTNLFFTKDRSAFSVTFGGTLAILITTNVIPKKIGTLSFKSPVIGSFKPKGSEVVYVSRDNQFHLFKYNKNFVVYSETKKIDSSRGEPSYVTWQKCGITIGTEHGNVYTVNFDQNIRDIGCMKNPVTYIASCGKQSHVAIDTEQNAVIFAQDVEKPLKAKVKKLKVANRESFSIHFAGQHSLSTVALIGNYRPLPPPCISRCPLLLDEEEYEHMIDDEKLNLNAGVFRLFGLGFMKTFANLEAIRESHLFLADYLSFFPNFTKLKLMVGRHKEVQQHLLDTKPDDKDYLIKMTKCALFDAPAVGASIFHVVKSFIDSGRVTEAVEMLLTVKAYDVASSKLIEIGQYEEAALLMRVIEKENRDMKLIQKIGESLLDKDTFTGLVLLKEAGFDDDVQNVITFKIGPKVAKLMGNYNK